MAWTYRFNMAFRIKNKTAFERKIDRVRRAGRELTRDLDNEIPVDYIFTLARNTPMAPKLDNNGKKIKNRGLAKSAWYKMLKQFGKRGNRRRMPPKSYSVKKNRRRNKQSVVLTNSVDYIGYLDRGGKNTPPANILRKSEIEMDRRTERRLKRTGKALERVWRR